MPNSSAPPRRADAAKVWLGATTKARRPFAILIVGGVLATVPAVGLVTIPSSAERSGARPIETTGGSGMSEAAQVSTRIERTETDASPKASSVLAAWRKDQETLREQIAQLRDQIARYDARVSTFAEKKPSETVVANAATTAPVAPVSAPMPPACRNLPQAPLVVRFTRAARNLGATQLASLDALAASVATCRGANVRIEQAIDPDSARPADMRLAEHRAGLIAAYLGTHGVDGGSIDYDTIPLAARGLDQATERDKVLATDVFEIAVARASQPVTAAAH